VAVVAVAVGQRASLAVMLVWLALDVWLFLLLYSCGFYLDNRLIKLAAGDTTVGLGLNGLILRRRRLVCPKRFPTR
jgi:hypothetical protein